MPLGEGFLRFVSRGAGVCLALALSCASNPWPDEPGVPVALGRAANVDAGDSFLSALTATREARGLPAPMVTPRYQSEIGTFADDLQGGKTSAAGARRAIEAWGGSAYRRTVKSWLVDCGKGSSQLPSALAELPSAVVSYAAAHFRPRSLATDQCVVLVVAPTGAGEAVRAVGPVGQ
ncbi:MAG TPA: hypothetical protein VI456_01160 [Polyangia bacterium]